MWRAFFLAIGISCCLLGMEAMAIDKAVLNVQGKLASRLADRQALGIQQTGSIGRLELVPPDWAPWSLISGGVVVILYSFSIPRRVRG